MHTDRGSGRGGSMMNRSSFGHPTAMAGLLVAERHRRATRSDGAMYATTPR